VKLLEAFDRAKKVLERGDPQALHVQNAITTAALRRDEDRTRAASGASALRQLRSVRN
jgi:hypothetical protein